MQRKLNNPNHMGFKIEKEVYIAAKEMHGRKLNDKVRELINNMVKPC